MNILGINSSRAAPARVDPHKSRPLADGGAALLQEGRIACAAIEERFTRTRYEGGFRRSLFACLAQGRVALEDLDAVGHSTCCDIAWTHPDDILGDIAESCEGLLSRRQIDSLRHKVFTVDHHESHAALAFAGSGFRRALIAVIDGMGNRRGADSFDISSDWWRGAFQRQDYYLCEWREGRLLLEKVHEDAAGPGEIGIGEIYRSVTHYLGWRTYQHAGKTMALAAYGNPENLAKVRFVNFEPPFTINVPVADAHSDPFRQVEEALLAAGYSIPAGLGGPASPSTPFLCDLAAVVQRQTELALLQAVPALADRFGVADVAFGGGVSLNCVALGKLAAHRPDLNLYVPPAPGDTGLALGNALWLAYASRSPVVERVSFAPIRSAALSADYSVAAIDRAVSDLVATRKHIKAAHFADPTSLSERIVDNLVAGRVVGLRRGRAEYGPRALGHASILADPRSEGAHDAVNAIKRREPFRPYAPSILSEHVTEYFDIKTPSPFMSFAGFFHEKVRGLVPAVVHLDGSARYQTVDNEAGFYRTLLEAFDRRTGVPILLNTSFNMDGEPIVETPQDALDAFERSGLSGLVLGDWYLTRDEAGNRDI